jgi:hypothetical protein
VAKLIHRDLNDRFFAWGLYCPCPRGDAAQGRRHQSHLSSMLTYLAIQVGLLREDLLAEVSEAYNRYVTEPADQESIQTFKTEFCHLDDISINFVGVW